MLSLIASKEDATVNLNTFHCFILLHFGSTIANLTVFKEKLFLIYLSLKLILGHLTHDRHPTLSEGESWAETKWEWFQSIWETISCWATPAVHTWVMQWCVGTSSGKLALVPLENNQKRGQKFEVTSNTYSVSLSVLFGISRATWQE